MTLSKRPTIADVANRARVSRTSVSRVLNGRGELTQETVQRVLTAIDDLGYRPNEVARSLSFQRTRTIGMIVYDILNPGMAECVYTAQEELACRDYQVILTCMGGHMETGRACLSMLEDRRVDAVITAALLDQTGSDGGRPLPFIQKDGVQCYDPLNGRVSLVKFDEVAGGYQAASHLLALGHRRIGIVAGPSYWGAVEERIEGYGRAFPDRGLTPEPPIVEDAPEWTVPAGYAATLRLLDRAPDLTAIWALYDVLAIGVVRALHDRGKRIPEDVAVIGFNDEVFASYTTPRLTSVRADCNTLGRVAARLTLEMLDDESVPGREVIVPTELVVRESTVALAETRPMDTADGQPGIHSTRRHREGTDRQNAGCVGLIMHQISEE